MQEILYEVSGHVATVTLNRPDKLNAWTRLMEQEIRQAMEQAAGDSTVRVIVLTGAGRGFCAGADMSLLNSVVQRGLGNEHPLPTRRAMGHRLPSRSYAPTFSGNTPTFRPFPSRSSGRSTDRRSGWGS